MVSVAAVSAVNGEVHGLALWRRGCRCLVCRDARAEYDRELKARRVAMAEAEAERDRHGKEPWTRGCGCFDCLLAHLVWEVDERLWAAWDSEDDEAETPPHSDTVKAILAAGLEQAVLPELVALRSAG